MDIGINNCASSKSRHNDKMFSFCVLLSLVTVSRQQILINTRPEFTSKLPSGVLLFVPSDKCYSDNLSSIVLEQTKTIADLRKKVEHIGEMCSSTKEPRTTPSPVRPTIPTGATDCNAIVKMVMNETEKLETLNVEQTKGELQLANMKTEYRKHRSLPCTRSFDGIGEAQIVHQVYEQHGRTGAWMKDPSADADKVWIMAGHSNVNLLVEYESEFHLIANKPTVTHTIPVTCDGTGHVVYKGAFYCNKYNTDDIIRYDLKTKTLITRDLNTFAGRYHHSSYGYPGSYQWTLYNGIDLAVDELGLWVIYVNPDIKSRQLTFSKVDPDNLNVLQTWITSVQKRSYGEAFMVCGKLFAVASYSSSSNYVYYSYDSVAYTAKSYSSVTMPFHTYKYDHQFSSLSYNPKERALYSWHHNSGSLVRYPLLSSYQ